MPRRGSPILPATSLKGVTRDYAARDGSTDPGGLTHHDLDRLFGRTVGDVMGAEGTGPQDDLAMTQLEAGALVFTEGRLVAFPVRSLKSAISPCDLSVDPGAT